MHKSAATWFLDSARHLMTIGGTVAVLCLFSTKAHWLLPVVSAIPVYLIMFCFVDFVTLPLFLLTPEHRVISIILNAIEKDDLDKALRVLQAYEKRPSMMLQAVGSTIEITRHIPRADFFHASLLLPLLFLSGYETVFDRLSFLDTHSAWKSVFTFLIFALSVAAVAWRIWAEWREVELERARYDIERILKKRGRASFDRLRRVRPKYAPKFLNELIQTYPNVFKRTTIKKKKKPAIILVKE